LARRIDMMTRYQTNEGLTLLGAEDEFQAITYSFAGLDTVLLAMGQQLSGALQIPLVRLFGQAPQGLNATGDADIRLFYDGLHQAQEIRLRRPLTRAIKCLAQSEQIKLPDKFNFQFRPLWQLLPKEKAEVAEIITRIVLSADELGIISTKRTLEELRQQGRETGIWSTITDKEIDSAEDEPVPEVGPLAGMVQPGGTPGEPPRKTPEGEPGQGQPAAGKPVAPPVPMPTVHLGGKAA
jgi:hypothetical protein